jgi:hypothetical protein
MLKMNTPKHKLTLKSWYSWDELTIEFDWDTNQDGMITIFKTMAKFLTFWDEFLEYND